MQKKLFNIILTSFLLITSQRVFSQKDTLCDPNETKKIFGELYFNYGSVTNAYSAYNRSGFVVGQPLVSTQNMLSQAYQAGLGVYSSWYLPPPTTLFNCLPRRLQRPNKVIMEYQSFISNSKWFYYLYR